MDKKQRDQFYLELGKAIKSARANQQKTQEEIANVAGLNRVSIINIETGKQRIQIDALLMICKFLKISLEEILPPLPETIDPSFEKILSKDRRKFEGESDSVINAIKAFSTIIKKTE